MNNAIFLLLIIACIISSAVTTCCHNFSREVGFDQTRYKATYAAVSIVIIGLLAAGYFIGAF